MLLQIIAQQLCKFYFDELVNKAISDNGNSRFLFLPFHEIQPPLLKDLIQKIKDNFEFIHVTKDIT